jgi:PilZ domain
MAAGKDRRRSERYATASIPVQLSDVNGELIDLSLTGAAVVHRSPVKAGAAATLIFPSYGGIYIPCEVLRSIVQVRRGSGEKAPEYVFRSAIVFNALPPEQEQSFHEFLQIQIKRLEEAQRAAGET